MNEENDEYRNWTTDEGCDLIELVMGKRYPCRECPVRRKCWRDTVDDIFDEIVQALKEAKKNG